MAKRLLLFAAAFALSAACAATGRGGTAVPKVLVVQLRLPATKSGDPNVLIANFLAQEIDDAGKLSAVIWSVTDPVFRDALASGKLQDLPKEPRVPDVFRVGRALGAEYALICDASRSDKASKCNVRLYRGHREIWRDTEVIDVSLAGKFDPSGSARSIARTVALKMDSAPLKGLTVESKASTPDFAKGQAPVVSTDVVPASGNTDAELKTNVDALLKDKKYSAAVSAVRDAVDDAPFDAERRKMLIDILLPHDPAAAAQEAQRAGAILPDQSEFRIIAARAWISAGQPKEAQEALNEAVARAPDAAETRLMLGEIALQNLEPEKALPHLDQAIKSSPTSEGYFLRALCRSLLGGNDGVRLDVVEMDKAEPTKSAEEIGRHYDLIVSVYGRLLSKEAGEMRNLIQHAIVKPKDAGVRDEIETNEHRLAAQITLLQMIAVPPDRQKAYERWVLAHKLLAQALLDLTTFTSGDADALTDARMNFGEALSQAEQAKGHSP